MDLELEGIFLKMWKMFQNNAATCNGAGSQQVPRWGLNTADGLGASSKSPKAMPQGKGARLPTLRPPCWATS